MVKRYYVRVRSLKNGMVIDQSIVDATRRPLIVKGAVLDDYLIEALGRLGIAGVYVREGQEEIKTSKDEPVKEERLPGKTIDTIEKLTVSDPSRVKLTESVRKRVAEGISYLYNNTDSDNLVNVTENITHDLRKSIQSNDALAVDINMLKVSDEYTFKHSVDVATMAMIVAKSQKMSDSEIHDIGFAGLLHDIGKSKIPNEILNKPERLTDEEFEIMKKHPVYGYNILKKKQDIKDSVRLGVLQHHERIDGRGYPMGVDYSRIVPFAKIISVVDIYDALVTERPYKSALSQRDAVEMIMAMTAELDMGAIRGFLKSVILYPVGSTIILSNGEKAKVVENYSEYILRPKVVGLKSAKVYDLAYDVNCANIIIL